MQDLDGAEFRLLRNAEWWNISLGMRVQDFRLLADIVVIAGLEIGKQKISERQTSAGNQSSFPVVRLSGCQVIRLSGCQVIRLSRCQVVKFDPWDMLNNFCFHVYAQKSNGHFWGPQQQHPIP